MSLPEVVATRKELVHLTAQLHSPRSLGLDEPKATFDPL